MSGEKILILGDSIEGPTGFANNLSTIAWSLAKEYDVHVLGLQSVNQQRVKLDMEGEIREITQHPNLPRGKDKWDFGTKSLPRLMKQLQPDILFTLNDIQMIQHVPNVLYPNMANIKMIDFPSKKMVSRDALIMELDGHIQRFKEKYPLDTKWIAYCFTPDTEVLTPDGIKNITDFKIGDKVYTLNPDTGETEVTDVIDTIERESNDGLITVKHKKVDFQVTLEHEFYIDGKTITAQELYDTKSKTVREFSKYKQFCGMDRDWFDFYKFFDGEYLIRIPMENDEKLSEEDVSEPEWKLNHSDKQHFWENKEKNIHTRRIATTFSDAYAKSNSKNGEHIPLRVKWRDFLSLAGWYISEGYLDKRTQKIDGSKKEYTSYRVCISQSIEYNRDKIKSLLNRMGIKFHERKTSISFSGRFYYSLFNELFHNSSEHNSANRKYIPKEFMKYSDMDSLFNSLMDGDGHWDKREHSIGNYTTTSKQLVDDFIHLCFLLGYKTSVYTEYKDKPNNNLNDVYIISIFRKTNPGITGNHIDKIPYEGNVYCITAKDNHIIFAGRNKKFCAIKQCPEDGDPPMMQWKNIYSMADKCVAFGKYGKDLFKQYFNMDVPYIYHSIDSANFENKEKPDNLKDKFVIGNFNRNQPRKQPVRTMMAFAKFAKDKPDALLHMQMDWNDQFGWPIQYFAQLYGIMNKMIQPRQVGMPRKEVSNTYNMWDLNVNSHGGEGFGIVAIEGMKCGLPYISTDYTTSRELTIDGKPSPRGIVVQPKELYWEKMDVAAVQRAAIDVDKLADAFNTYYYNKDLLKEHGENGEVWVKKNCLVKNQQNKWLKLIKETLSMQDI